MKFSSVCKREPKIIHKEDETRKNRKYWDLKNCFLKMKLNIFAMTYFLIKFAQFMKFHLVQR